MVGAKEGREGVKERVERGGGVSRGGGGGNENEQDLNLIWKEKNKQKTKQTATGVTSDQIHSNTWNHHSLHLLHGGLELVHVLPAGPSVLMRLLLLPVFPLQVE